MIDITAIGLGVDTSKLTKGTKELDNFGRSAKSAAGQADQSTKSMGAMTSIAGRLAVVLGAAGLGSALIKTIDGYTKYNAQLKLATQTQQQFNTALADVQRIAKTAQSDISSVATLYARLNSSLREVGVTQQEVARITENVGLALKVSGATAAESSSAIMQLSQAFASGVLRGEEFNAVSESAPALMRALADSIGVPIGQLRSMAADGKLTLDVLRNFGDEKLLAKFRDQAKEVETMSGAWQAFKNNFIVYIGDMDKAVGASKYLAKLLNFTGEILFRPPMVLSGQEQDAANKKELEFLSKKGALGVRENARLEQLAALRKRMGITGNQLGGVAAITDGRTYAPNFTSTVEAENIDDIHRRQEDALRKAKELQDKRNQAAEEAARKETEVRKYLFNLEQELNNEVTKRYNQAVKIREKDDKEEYERKSKIMDDLQKQANENFKESQRETEKQANEYNRIFERANDNLSRSLTDSIVRGFERGEKLIDNFKNAITNAFRSYFVNIGVNFAQSALGGVASGVGNSILDAIGLGSGAGASGSAGFSGVLKDLGNIFTTSNSAIISGIEGVGASIANGMGGIRDTIGGFVGANASMLANVASYGGAILQLSQGNWAGAIGTGIGTALGGPLGGAIGSFLGGAVGSMFGGGVKTKKYSTGATTNYSGGKLTGSQGLSGIAGYGRGLGGQDALTALGEQYSKVMGSLFKAFDLSDEISTSSSIFQRSGKKTRSWGYFNASFGSGGGANFETGHQGTAQNSLNAIISMAMTTGITQGIRSSNLPQAIKDLFNELTDQTQILNMVNATIALSKANQALVDSFNITAEQTAKVALLSGQTGDELVKVIGAMLEAANASRTIGDALFEFRNELKEALGGNLYSSLSEFDNALKSIDKTTQAGIESFYELFALRGDFAKFQAQIDSMKGGVRGALFGIVSDAEKQAMMNEDLAKMFTQLNIEVPASIQELISLGKSIDYTTAEGLNLAAVFPSLVQAFNETKNAADELMNSLRDTSSFSTLAAFNRYSGLARNYGTDYANATWNMPSYDVGTSYVPQTGTALIHQGERILTSSENARFTQDSASIVAEMRTLNAKVDRLVYSMDKTASSTKRTADIMVNITPNGDAIQTEAVA